jgi:hypothetical protein
VTVVIRVGALDAPAWQTVAFSLRDLRLVSVGDRHGLTTEEQVRTAVEEGLKLYSRKPFRYADLPAFDAVRYLGGDPEDYAPRARDREVLVLCPFDDDYGENCWPEVQRALRDNWGRGVDPGPARRVIDLQSPELVSNRLYGAIRRDAECVVDLTLNRPNVFFELGARMVANEKGARTIRCADLTAGAGSQTAGFLADCDNLDLLLGTRTYNVRPEDPKTQVADAIQVSASQWPGGTVSAGYAFAIAQGRFDDMRPDRDVRDSTLEVVRLLREGLGLGTALRAEWEDIENRLSSH